MKPLPWRVAAPAIALLCGALWLLTVSGCMQLSALILGAGAETHETLTKAIEP